MGWSGLGTECVWVARLGTWVCGWLVLGTWEQKACGVVRAGHLGTEDMWVVRAGHMGTEASGWDCYCHCRVHTCTVGSSALASCT